MKDDIKQIAIMAGVLNTEESRERDVIPPAARECIISANRIIHQLLGEREWQPIDTAPKDGTVVIVSYLATNEPILVGACGFVELPKPDDCDVYQSHGWVEARTDELHHPTHWIPLPQLTKEDL